MRRSTPASRYAFSSNAAAPRVTGQFVWLLPMNSVSVAEQEHGAHWSCWALQAALEEVVVLAGQLRREFDGLEEQLSVEVARLRTAYYSCLMPGHCCAPAHHPACQEPWKEVVVSHPSYNLHPQQDAASWDTAARQPVQDALCCQSNARCYKCIEVSAPWPWCFSFASSQDVQNVPDLQQLLMARAGDHCFCDCT